MQGGLPTGASDSAGSIAKMLAKLREMPPPGRERAWFAFLDGLEGLFVDERV